jgi:hypothetical protein
VVKEVRGRERGPRKPDNKTLLDDRWGALCTESLKYATYFAWRAAENIRGGLEHNCPAMGAAMKSAIPNRAQTLKLLRLMGEHAPLLLLRGEADGYGDRWTLHGGEVLPAIAGWLMQSGYVADAGATEMGARRLLLTPAGVEFRRQGLDWWAQLGPLARLRVVVFG